MFGGWQGCIQVPGGLVLSLLFLLREPVSTKIGGRKRPNVNMDFVMDPIRISLWDSDKTTFLDIKSLNCLAFIMSILILLKGLHLFLLDVRSLINVIKESFLIALCLSFPVCTIGVIIEPNS